MIENSLSSVLEKVIKVSGKLKAKVVLIGGIATSFFAQPRATYDIDGVISLDEKKLDIFLDAFKKAGFEFDKKKPIKSIQGLPFVTFYYPMHKIYVDFFIAKNEFQKGIIKRSKKIKFGDLNLFIVSAEDLILLKLQVQREKDIEDVRQIILENKKKLDFQYLNKWAKLLRVDVFLKDELESLG